MSVTEGRGARRRAADEQRGTATSAGAAGTSGAPAHYYDAEVDAAARVIVDRMLPGNWGTQSEGVRDAVRAIADEVLNAAAAAGVLAERLEVEL